MSVAENLTGPNRLLSCLTKNFNYNLVDKTKLSSEDPTKAAPKFLSKLTPFALGTRRNNWFKLTCLNYIILKLKIFSLVIYLPFGLRKNLSLKRKSANKKNLLRSSKIATRICKLAQ